MTALTYRVEDQHLRQQVGRLVCDVMRESVELAQGRRLGLREQVPDSGGGGDVAEVFQ